MLKLKTVFIPLASTKASSSPSLSTPPLDDGITTVKHYIYLHSNLNPRTHDTTKKYHFNWHDNIKLPIPLYLQQHLCFQIAVQRCVDTAAEVIATHREARLTFLQGLVRRMLRETCRGISQSPFNLDTNYTEWY